MRLHCFVLECNINVHHIRCSMGRCLGTIDYMAAASKALVSH